MTIIAILSSLARRRSSCSRNLSLISSSMDVFKGKTDNYKGVTVRSQEEPCAPDAFNAKLTQSLEEWISGGVRGVWFLVHIGDTEWVPVLAKHGFNFHHTKQDQVAMIKWLPETETVNIPDYAHHNVGVGGMVVNAKDELLVIRERMSVFQQWKLPGGYVDPGENIQAAAVREVMEETGVKTTFKSIVAFRQGHKYNFNCSDIYIICHLEPSADEQELTPCEREVAAAKWVPIKEYLEMDDVHNINKFFVNQFLDARERGSAVQLTEMDLVFKQYKRHQNLFSVKPLEDETTSKI